MHGSAANDECPVVNRSVPRRSFEALLLSSHPTPPSLAEALGEAGFDADCPEHLYPYPVWTRALHAARSALYPELEPCEGLFALGGRFARGFRLTVVGRVLRAHADARLGPERALARLPSTLGAGVKGLVMEVQPTRARSWQLRCLAPSEEADFYAGAVHGLLADLALTELEVRVVAREEDAFELVIAWAAPALAS